MKIVLASGIYSPDIGGPATYVRALAKELTARGVDVTVVTYVRRNFQFSNGRPIVRVSMFGGPLLRWMRYARALKKHGADAAIIYCFSSVSTGIPLWLSGLKKPKRVLRLGGDFFWERYTDLGGGKTLKEWYENRFFVSSFIRLFVGWLLRTFDHIIFSTRFQEEIYERHFKRLSPHSVIENAFSMAKNQKSKIKNQKSDSFRLLFMGRFVGFKNLPALIISISHLPWVSLTLIGEGPMKKKLKNLVKKLHLDTHVRFIAPLQGEEKQNAFFEHDLLILPSLTEISPHVALEARAAGLPILLTEQTGLSLELRKGIIVRKLRMPEDITRAIVEVQGNYESFSGALKDSHSQRSWEQVVDEHVRLFSELKIEN